MLSRLAIPDSPHPHLMGTWRLGSYAISPSDEGAQPVQYESVQRRMAATQQVPVVCSQRRKKQHSGRLGIVQAQPEHSRTL